MRNPSTSLGRALALALLTAGAALALALLTAGAAHAERVGASVSLDGVPRARQPRQRRSDREVWSIPPREKLADVSTARVARSDGQPSDLALTGRVPGACFSGEYHDRVERLALSFGGGIRFVRAEWLTTQNETASLRWVDFWADPKTSGLREARRGQVPLSRVHQAAGVSFYGFVDDGELTLVVPVAEEVPSRWNRRPDSTCSYLKAHFVLARSAEWGAAAQVVIEGGERRSERREFFVGVNGIEGQPAPLIRIAARPGSAGSERP
jgi:hypothetical protein